VTALVRQYIKATPVRLLVASKPCRVTLWEGPTVDRESITEAIFISYSEAKCTIAAGLPLPRSNIVTLNLDAGTELWAVCADQAVLALLVD
jgi:hypothetical protein